ncbi:M48 family metallopeptidase [Burkholderia sp. Bp8986]|nr:M48 family metallopeptidase [Burkholderia sp. Bp8986]RQS56856.1 M48 family peptidase [Burkholderia sp. Bp8986]
MELAGSVQDYIIVHELCHTVEKNHTRAFWGLVAQFMPGWRREHEALERVVHWDAI